MNRVNIGCGMAPTEGWENFDNSLSIRLAPHRTLVDLLYKFRLISPPQLAYIEFCRKNNIKWADATKRIPLPDSSVEVLYSSHMLEHLDRTQAFEFLREARRVMVPGGIIRIAVPDLEIYVRNYLIKGDADLFIGSMQISASQPRTISEKLRAFFLGTRHHQWMYDRKSLCRTLDSNGFINSVALPAGDTKISEPSHLDRFERVEESI